MPQVVLGTAGHIDHGKTSLVKALTGFNTDRLIEEKDRGMTIDLGFAYLNDSITIIDVPGHEKFIRNMTAGAANIHYGLIVVAADDGVMPQTIEHLDILTLLGVNKGWVAITKIDVVKDLEWIDLVEIEIQECLTSRGFKSLSMNRINNLNGDGIQQLKSDIENIIDDVKPYDRSEYFRMNVDRVFSKTGFGTVATGTVINGGVNKGDEIEILPGKLKTRIRGLQSHGGNTEKVYRGDRAAINLSNIKINELCRGSVISTVGIIKKSKQLIANISMIKSTNWKIKNNQRLRFHFGTSEVLGRVTVYGQRNLENDKMMNMVLNLESPVAVALDDRFVVRSYSPMETIAGGIVLDSKPNTSWSKLSAMILDMPLKSNKRFRYLVECNWRRPRTLEFWKNKFFNSSYKIQLSKNENDLKISGNGILYSNYGKERSIEEIRKYFAKCYDNNPYRRVVTAESIRSHLRFSEAWLEVIINQMIQGRIIEDCDGGFALSKYEVQFSKRDIDDIAIIEEILQNNNLEPTLLIKIIDITGHNSKRVKDLLHILNGQGKVNALGHELYLHQTQLNLIIFNLKKYFLNKNSMAVGDFKVLTGLTRKSAIPLLEYLDKNNFTHREDNMRYAGERLDE